jgi:VanZ family protein
LWLLLHGDRRNSENWTSGNFIKHKPMLRHFLPAIAWLIFITIVSTRPGLWLPTFNLISTDKLAHAFVYFVLTLLLLWGWDRYQTSQKAPVPSHNASGLYAFGLAGGYGALMEWVQGTFFPGRSFEFDDMIANAVGAAIGWAGYRWLKKWFSKS